MYYVTCTYTHTFIRIHIHIRIHAHIHVHICVHVQTFIYPDKIICTRTSTDMRISSANASPMYTGFMRSNLANDIPESKPLPCLVYACGNTQHAHLHTPQYRYRRRTVPYQEGGSCASSPTWNVASQRVSENWTQGRNSDTSVSRRIAFFFGENRTILCMCIPSENRNNPPKALKQR